MTWDCHRRRIHELVHDDNTYGEAECDPFGIDWVIDPCLHSGLRTCPRRFIGELRLPFYCNSSSWFDRYPASS